AALVEEGEERTHVGAREGLAPGDRHVVEGDRLEDALHPGEQPLAALLDERGTVVLAPTVVAVGALLVAVRGQLHRKAVAPGPHDRMIARFRCGRDRSLARLRPAMYNRSPSGDEVIESARPARDLCLAH